MGIRALLIVTLALPAGAVSPPAPPGARARAYLTSLLAASRAPALAAAVAIDGRLVFSEGVGTADIERNVAADANTVFNIGSLSKLETAVAVMQLVETGKVRLGDDIRKFVPSFPAKGAPITILELLTHSSGIRNYNDSDFPDTPEHDNLKPFATFEAAITLFKDDPLLFPPGRFFFYSSYAVNLLQGVIETASGLPFEEYMRVHVWQPAGMTRSSFDVPGRTVASRARSYRLRPSSVEPIQTYDLTYKFASGGMLGTAEDLVRFACTLSAGTLLRPGTVSEMFRPVASPTLWYRGDKPPGRERYKQAIMWRILDYRGRHLVYECGSVNGFNMCLVYDVADKAVSALATNCWGSAGGWKQTLELGGFFLPTRANPVPLSQ
jgi:serine beta-lactamase-like protein LACTB, mitochondrial